MPQHQKQESHKSNFVPCNISFNSFFNSACKSKAISVDNKQFGFLNIGGKVNKNALIDHICIKYEIL